VLAIVGEHAPNRRSRISLSDERDALGQRRAVVDLRFQEADLASLRRSIEAFAAVLARRGVGRIRVEREDYLESGFAPDHHMGTTRMAADPRNGVTDGTGRVHGVENLYVGGSSLFPTSGFANPTLTIVALALRLADHLTRAGGCRA
jgi:choline dehydrogenase-like flavoprotein